MEKDPRGVIVGSNALQALWPGQRKPSDIDIICDQGAVPDILDRLNITDYAYKETKYGESYRDENTGVILDIEFTASRPSSKLIVEQWGAAQDPALLLAQASAAAQMPMAEARSTGFHPVGPGVLYAIKMTHRYLKNSPHFWKTAEDIQTLRSKLEMPKDIQTLLETRPDIAQWYSMREGETYDYDPPALNRTKAEFFSDDGINYIYDHDSLHEAVAIEGAPAYLQYLKPGSEVAVDMNVFFELPIWTRFDGVMEEVMVLALERSLIPFFIEKNDRLGALRHEKQATMMALMKVCSSITSGKFREFAWEHVFELREELLEMIDDHEGPVARFTHGNPVRLEENDGD